MKCLVELDIPLEDLFSGVSIELDNYYDKTAIPLYTCIENQLITEIEQYGAYETFYDAVDTVTKDEDNEDVIDAFVTMAKEKIIDIIKHHDLKIVSCTVNSYHHNFDVVVDINFTRLWKQFKYGEDKGCGDEDSN
jgi:hypothetical protein